MTKFDVNLSILFTELPRATVTWTPSSARSGRPTSGWWA